MKKVYIKTRLVFGFVRCFPHLISLNSCKNKSVIQYDTLRWLKIKGLNYNQQTGFIYLMTFFPEFRNLFYKRIGYIKFLLEPLCPKLETLYLYTDNIGPGLFIQHGFSTIITAESIGKDCWINQQVTVGYSLSGRPVILDNVSITAGAKIIGNITIGNNSVIGANAVVIKNVPDNCTVVGIPAFIVKRNGVKVREELA